MMNDISLLFLIPLNDYPILSYLISILVFPRPFPGSLRLVNFPAWNFLFFRLEEINNPKRRSLAVGSA